MWLYESGLLGIRMAIPDGWEVQSWPDDGIDELLRYAETGETKESGGACAGALRPLMNAYLYAPRTRAEIDACIELQACDDDFLKTGDSKPLKKWTVNGFEILYSEDSRDGSPEMNYYRFPRWQVAPGVWLYARMLASGKERFEYVLSVFETLCHLDSMPDTNSAQLFEREPWNTSPSLYRLTKSREEGRPLYDLALDADDLEVALNTNAAILSGQESLKRWTTLDMRRKSRVLSLDCYYGPQELFSSGVFSERAIDLLRPFFNSHFSELPCNVNGKPFYFLRPNPKGDSFLDTEHSQIRRFSDGGIMGIKRYRFNASKVSDPLIFAIPEERNGVFATNSIRAKVVDSGLKGIAFHPLDGYGREYSCPG